jgi:hypothetical protein
VEDLILTGDATASGVGNDLANSITGNAANNILNGLAGDDSLRGGGGDDRLIGGPGDDRLIGSGGRNSFQFDAPLNELTNVDRILDFDPTKDVMRLIGEVFPALTTAGPLSSAAFRVGVAANDASDRILYDPNTGVVRYDVDGTGPTASVRFATLVSMPAITNADFVIVDPVAAAVSFSAQIQPIFNQRCDQCHSGSSAPQGLRLDAANSYTDLVNVDSHEVPSLKRVEPGDPDNSYLVQKVEGTADVGGRMPLGGERLSDEDIDLIRQWISEGATSDARGGPY